PEGVPELRAAGRGRRRQDGRPHARDARVVARDAPRGGNGPAREAARDAACEEVMRRAARLGLVATLLAPTPLVAQDAPPAVIRFLDRKEAAVAIGDESMEPYFSIMQPMEMLAKTSVPLEATELAKQRDECRQRYRDAVREFTDDEKAAVTDAVNEIHDALRLPYPLVAETPWTFLKLDPSIEGGMPFTHGAAIVLPD